MTLTDALETRQSFLSALRAAHNHPSANLISVRPRGCDIPFLMDLLAADRHEEHPRSDGVVPLTSRDQLAALGAYGGTLAGLVIARSNIPAEHIDAMLDRHDHGSRDEVLSMAADALGINEKQAHALFMEDVMSEDIEAALALGELNYRHAALTFQRLLSTGTVDRDSAVQ